MNGRQLIGPVGVYPDGDGKVHICIEAVDALEQMVYQVFGPVQIVYGPPKRSLEERISQLERLIQEERHE